MEDYSVGVVLRGLYDLCCSNVDGVCCDPVTSAAMSRSIELSVLWLPLDGGATSLCVDATLVLVALCLRHYGRTGGRSDGVSVFLVKNGDHAAKLASLLLGLLLVRATSLQPTTTLLVVAVAAIVLIPDEVVDVSLRGIQVRQELSFCGLSP